VNSICWRVAPTSRRRSGSRFGPLRRGVYLVASLATAAAVTHAGAIGFIGLIVPHLVRLATGNDQRLLLPASVLAGGSLLVIADTLARTMLAPQQLPVGVLTALIGVPVFSSCFQPCDTRPALR
jgi:iron complex transport system permease protein